MPENGMQHADYNTTVTKPGTVSLAIDDIGSVLLMMGKKHTSGRTLWGF